MKRVNTFRVAPQSDEDEELLRRLLDASASLWNELNYERRQNYFADDDSSVWDTDEYRGRYNGIVGSATVQQLTRKNSEAWRSFFSLKESGDCANPPGYWGNEEDGRTLRTYIRCNQYTLEWGKRSRLEIPVGQDLKEEYGLGYHDRLRLEVRGNPKWDGKQGRLEITYDETSDTYRAFQPVTVPDSRQDSPLADETAALDVGANNIVACSVSTGSQYLYEGRDLFERFRETTTEIGRLQSKLPEGRYSSNRIRRLYRQRTRRRDHAMNAVARDLVERLYDEGVATVYVGDLTDVLESNWSVRANAKTHNFWAFRAFINRLACVCEEYGIVIEARTEAWTSQECPDCGEREGTVRHEDTLTCPCGFEGHADLTASETFLKRETSGEVGPMARPARFKWDDHSWSASSCACPNEQRANPQVASVGR
ncbi:RNA-guided endonuclease InsQ/TnpB family protein [Natronolimnobius baerhuensis]|uniref:Transposase n=1 Tax=Natronolimnobius baerhuensis TaxID=253108 RepID=A0A202E3S1_9EURY|nr:RNA-guided endonuclease TnpB family protein [Natronolimnobius baerhuensis]OVE82867.1 transposase [Natronolimnobius baerhuensis]